MIEKFIGHMHWANATIIDWLEVERSRSADYLRLISHILNVERIWISRINGLMGDPDRFKVHPLGDLRELNESNFHDFGQIANADVRRPISYKLFNGTPRSGAAEDLILHAFSHGFHHAGQMASIASSSGDQFPDTSYLAFTWK